MTVPKRTSILLRLLRAGVGVTPALLLVLTACAALPSIKNVLTGETKEMANAPLWNYRADLFLTLEGETFEGMAATILKGPVDIEIISKVGIDRIQVSSCARQDVCQSGDPCPAHMMPQPGWFGQAGKRFTYRYHPTKTELNGMCPLYIEVFQKTGLAAWGFVGFRKDEDLPAHIDCNGQGWTYAGYTVCQTKNGKEQTVEFKTPVEDFEAEAICSMSTKDNRVFTFRPAIGICRATFYDKGHWHTLNLFGYDKVLVREK